MNLDDVVDELCTALRGIEGLRVPDYGVQTINPPAAIVTLPVVDFDETYGRGTDKYDLELMVLVPKPESREARKMIAPFVTGSGPTSVKQAIESYPYTACDEPNVRSCEFEGVTYAGTSYLSATFHIDITGPGE